MKELFQSGTHYSREIVKAMLTHDMEGLRRAMVANEVTVLVDAIDAGEDPDLLQTISDEVRRVAECDEDELMRVARDQCHWDNLDL